jgi:hypothetical protein
MQARPIHRHVVVDNLRWSDRGFLMIPT